MIPCSFGYLEESERRKMVSQQADVQTNRRNLLALDNGHHHQRVRYSHQRLSWWLGHDLKSGLESPTAVRVFEWSRHPRDTYIYMFINRSWLGQKSCHRISSEVFIAPFSTPLVAEASLSRNVLADDRVTLDVTQKHGKMRTRRKNRRRWDGHGHGHGLGLGLLWRGAPPVVREWMRSLCFLIRTTLHHQIWLAVAPPILLSFWNFNIHIRFFWIVLVLST